jgi:transcriptional regulator with XRE-family HTH domain
MRKSVFTPEYGALRAEICAARARAGLSQRDLARRLKVPHSWVAKVESGERRIDFVECCWFFAACGIDPLSPLTKLVREMRLRRPQGSRKGAL